MENVSLKKGLFGYTQSSVQEYIEALNGELTARTNKFVLENEELKKKCELYEDKINESNAKQDELLEKINDLDAPITTFLSTIRFIATSLSFPIRQEYLPAGAKTFVDAVSIKGLFRTLI